MTHDELVQKANFIFDAIKKRDDLYFNGRGLGEMTPSEESEVVDHCKDVNYVLGIEALGIGAAGKADCFAIANVLLRAINRQWREAP
jgi:hypothetical protein